MYLFLYLELLWRFCADGFWPALQAAVLSLRRGSCRTETGPASNPSVVSLRARRANASFSSRTVVLLTLEFVFFFLLVLVPANFLSANRNQCVKRTASGGFYYKHMELRVMPMLLVCRGIFSVVTEYAVCTCRKLMSDTRLKSVNH